MSPVSPSPSPSVPFPQVFPGPNATATWRDTWKLPQLCFRPSDRWSLRPRNAVTVKKIMILKLLHTQLQMWNTHTHASATHNMLLSRVAVSLKRLLRAKRSRLELPPGWTLSTDFHPILMQVSPHIHFTLSDAILSKFPHPCTPHTPQTYSKMYDSSDHFFNTIIDVFMPSTFCSDKVT